ncbi:hypothetical protein PVK06_035997 [Gossypium arboreum]|uniref:Uncharacterized protein n=1 Tax=Gossypium arboreum TaxID=29729 RepID=A0ABR0NIQ8_GOSAR|nr:hypothetical protein PVK06_035997 [Gossypium arboreum]
MNYLMASQNESGKTALYILAENSFQEIFSCLLKFCDAKVVKMRSKSDLNTFHVVAKLGNLVGVTFVIVEKHHSFFRRVGDDLALTVEIQLGKALTSNNFVMNELM